ncbi:15027_t:CDS:1, partial [Acaulospora colombiana]
VNRNNAEALFQYWLAVYSETTSVVVQTVDKKDVGVSLFNR